MCVCVIIQYCPKESLTIPNVEQILDLQTSKYEEQNEWPILDLREGILSMSFFKVRWWKRKDISKSKTNSHAGRARGRLGDKIYNDSLNNISHP